MLKTRNHLLIFFLVVVIFGCEYKDLPQASEGPAVDCNFSTLSVSVSSKADATRCNLIDGSITVAGAGGTEPYAYSINGGTFQTSTTFSNLAPGIYTIQVLDASKCVRDISVDLFAGDSDLDAELIVNADSQCLTGGGSFSITAKGGTGPYTYQFGTGDFTDKPTFDAQAQGLKHGFYQVAVQDANSCPKSVNVVVPRSITNISFETDIKPIIDTKCAISGCHNGDNGPTRNWTIFSLFQKNAQNVKTRTGNKSMPLIGSLTPEQIQLIACWVDDGARDN